MEFRLGSVLILVEKTAEVSKLNQIISNHANIIIGRQGIRLREKDQNIISLVLEGSSDELGSLTGQLGRLKGIHVKSVLLKNLPE